MGSKAHTRETKSTVNYPPKSVQTATRIPGFLIVSKNGVVRMNKNYKGEDPFHPDIK